MKPVRVSDLPKTPEHGVILRCLYCGGEYSATRGDYFMADPNTVMKCHNRPMALVRRRTVYEQVKVNA